MFFKKKKSEPKIESLFIQSPQFPVQEVVKNALSMDFGLDEKEKDILDSNNISSAASEQPVENSSVAFLNSLESLNPEPPSAEEIKNESETIVDSEPILWDPLEDSPPAAPLEISEEPSSALLNEAILKEEEQFQLLLPDDPFLLDEPLSLAPAGKSIPATESSLLSETLETSILNEESMSYILDIVTPSDETLSSSIDITQPVNNDAAEKPLLSEQPSPRASQNETAFENFLRSTLANARHESMMHLTIDESKLAMRELQYAGGSLLKPFVEKPETVVDESVFLTAEPSASKEVEQLVAENPVASTDNEEEPHSCCPGFSEAAEELTITDNLCDNEQLAEQSEPVSGVINHTPTEEYSTNISEPLKPEESLIMIQKTEERPIRIPLGPLPFEEGIVIKSYKISGKSSTQPLPVLEKELPTDSLPTEVIKAEDKEDDDDDNVVESLSIDDIQTDLESTAVLSEPEPIETGFIQIEEELLDSLPLLEVVEAEDKRDGEELLQSSEEDIEIPPVNFDFTIEDEGLDSLAVAEDSGMLPEDPLPQWEREERGENKDSSTLFGSEFREFDFEEPELYESLRKDGIDVLVSAPMIDEIKLILVHHEGIFALMADNREKSVLLKSFKVNPLAYNDRFTVTQETILGNKALYIVQIGDWQAIVSIKNGEIKLQAEI